jgi:hypothetical protein
MEQRVYRGDIDPEQLADYLVMHFDPQPDLQAQRVGQGRSLLVQIGRGDVPADLRDAVSVAIAESSDEAGDGITVTLGQQQWLTPQRATYTAAIGLVSLLVTPFALFALLWPLSEAVGNRTMVGNIWTAIDNYVVGQGGEVVRTQDIAHPHAR